MIQHIYNIFDSVLILRIKMTWLTSKCIYIYFLCLQVIQHTSTHNLSHELTYTSRFFYSFNHMYKCDTTYKHTHTCALMLKMTWCYTDFCLNGFALISKQTSCNTSLIDFYSCANKDAIQHPNRHELPTVYSYAGSMWIPQQGVSIYDNFVTNWPLRLFNKRFCIARDINAWAKTLCINI